VSGEAKPAVPRGIRMDLERRDARLRELGITEEDIVAALLADVARERAVLRAPALFLAMFEDAHADDGWRARRRRRKEALASLEALRRHVQACLPCRAWLEVIVGMTTHLVSEPKTAPTE